MTSFKQTRSLYSYPKQKVKYNPRPRCRTFVEQSIHQAASLRFVSSSSSVFYSHSWRHRPAWLHPWHAGTVRMGEHENQTKCRLYILDFLLYARTSTQRKSWIEDDQKIISYMCIPRRFSWGGDLCRSSICMNINKSSVINGPWSENPPPPFPIKICGVAYKFILGHWEARKTAVKCIESFT